MAVFTAPKQRPLKSYKIETFKGIDLSNAPNNVEIYRSPYCPNMIREQVDKVRKRDGVQLVETFADQINGVHFLYGNGASKIVHAGENIYDESGNILWADAADNRSVSRQIAGKLWILDGKKFLVYDGTTIAAVENTGTIPVVIIARDPTGGGVLLNAINLLQAKRTEKFLGTAGTKDYQLTATEIDIAEVTVKQLKNDGTFDDLVEGTDFSVNRTLGKVSFNTAPGVSPIIGEDNVYITYAKTVAGYADRINKCDISILYGMNGSRDRLFTTGNPDYPHYDYHSQLNDPTYFGDLSYSVIGQDSSKIINYSIVNDYLVTHKDNAENDNNANLRSGELQSGKVVFVSQGSFQTTGALAKYSFADMENEPVYVTTDKNISAVTPSNVLGERFSQERSYYISGALKNEENLDNCFAFHFQQFYYLACASGIYIMDSLQYSVSKDRPLSHRQYECYYFPGIEARVMWEEDGELYFGTADGEIKKFEANVFNDEGEPIECWWDTPELDGGSFAYKKTFTYAAARIGAAVKTGLRVLARERGLWSERIEYNNDASFFDFGYIDFGDFTFDTDSTPRTLGQKIKIKNVDKAQFRFENSRLNEPFELYKALIEYSEGNKYRK